MHSFLSTPALFPFDFALCLLLSLSLIEIIGVMSIGSPLHFIDNFIPEIDNDFAAWLHLGRVPIMVLLIVFLSCFSTGGYVAQAVAQSLLSDYMPTWIGCIAGALAGLIGTKVLGAWIAKLLPKDQTFAVSENELIGLVGHVVTGVARRDRPAELKVVDKHGNAHFLMIAPEDDAEFPEGSAVVVAKKGVISFIGESPVRQN